MAGPEKRGERDPLPARERGRVRSPHSLPRPGSLPSHRSPADAPYAPFPNADSAALPKEAPEGGPSLRWGRGLRCSASPYASLPPSSAGGRERGSSAVTRGLRRRDLKPKWHTVPVSPFEMPPLAHVHSPAFPHVAAPGTRRSGASVNYGVRSATSSPCTLLALLFALALRMDVCPCTCEVKPLFARPKAEYALRRAIGHG